LVVDDEAPLAQMTGKMLEKLGYHVEVSTQPVEALHNAILQGVPYDLILTDLTMPGMTGTDFTKGVSCARPAARIVLMTGYVTKEQQEQLKTSGVREILIKPITMRNLAETVRQALKS
jgi:CheY-like chemotaxis protein